MSFFARIRRNNIEQLEKRMDELAKEHQALLRHRDNLLDLNADLERKLKDKERELKHQDDDLKHMVKLKESKLEDEYRRKELELEKRKFDEIAKVKDQYRDKLESHLKEQIGRLEKMYGELLARLPNIGVSLKGKVDGAQ